MRTILLALVLLTLAACSGEKTSEQHLARARDYIAKDDYPSAAIELQNALRLDGRSAEARWLLGKIYLDTGDILAGEKELQRAQDLGWTPDDVRPALAKTLLAQGKFADVLALEYEGLNPSAAALLFSRQAMAALSEQQPDKARALVDLALGKAPRLLEAKLAQATISVQQGEPAGALTLIDAILADAPGNGEAWGLKGQALVQQGKLEDARAAFDQSIARTAFAFADRVARGLINLQLKDYEAAQADATELLQFSPKDPAANYIQGLLLFHNKQYRSAITALVLAEPVAQQFPLGMYYLSAAYLIERDLDLAEKYGSQFVALAADNSNGRKLLAAILVLQHKLKEAMAVLQPVLDQNPDDLAALNIMANAMLLDGQADIGMVLYARIAQLQPDWHFVPLRTEAGLVASGSADEASSLLATTPDGNANFPQTEILLILNHLAKKHFAGAIEAAKSYRFRDLQSLAPYHVLGRVYLAAGQPDNARKVFEKALKREPGDPSANLSMAQMALEEGDSDTARRYYVTVLRKQPDDLATLLQLAALEAREKNKTAMVSYLNQAIQAHPAALEPRLRLAGYYLGSGSAEKVAPLFATLTALQQRSPRVLELTGLAHLAQKQNDSARVTFQLLVDSNPGSAQSHYLLAMAASGTGDQQKTRQELLEAIERDPKHVPARLNLARIAQGEGDERQFEQQLASLIELAPDAPDVLRLRALSAQAAGNPAEAVVLSQRAFKQAPSTQTVLELTAYQKAAGKNAAVRNTLQQWVKNHPRDVAVRLTLASELDLGKDLAEASAQYLAVLEVEPDNVTALNNLAWNLRLEDPKKALEYIRRAARIAPDHPEVIDTLAVVEGLNGPH